MAIDLFQPCRPGKLELKNRFVRSATWDATADDTGAVTDRSIQLFRDLARGEIGLIITGIAFVSPSGQAFYGQYGVHNDDMIPGLTRLAKTVHEYGAKIAVQIAHSGTNTFFLNRKGLTALAVSAQDDAKRPNREMTEEDIQVIIADFVRAAVRVRQAGFDAVQFHGAHGYLMSQFMSPLSNHRTDIWGGSAANRRRFTLEVVRQVRRAVGPDFPLMIKFGVQDDSEGGLTLSEGLATAGLMVREGMDIIEVSGGFGMSLGKKGVVYFQDRTAAVKRAVNVPVIAVGGIRDLAAAREIVDTGKADLIAMSRPFIREPGLIARWQRGDHAPAQCITCNKCFALVRHDDPLECGDEKQRREETGAPGANQ